MQIAILNKNLGEKTRGVLKTSGHFLFKAHIIFPLIIHIVGDITQKTCLHSEYLRSQQICCAVFHTIKLIGKNLISTLKRKCPEVFKTPLLFSSRF